ncbi:hypothetical protein PRK78_004997 [Emydomyces testavorans]|uniref:Piwi domain-containing protein n=1 Tax=Emydomyces testavorans TaxID=2070801 RepID=A0AAF0DJH6_9EURO|nr:hypothetical protein PRK78_004997 [Emydomyces testavorans]
MSTQPSYRGASRGGRGGGRGGDRGKDSARGGGRGGQRGDGRGGRGGDRGGDRGRGHGGRGRGVSSPPEIFRPPVEPALDEHVWGVENQYHAGAQELSLDSLSIKRQFPLRPGYGTQGTRVRLWANYFSLVADKTKTFFRYAVDIKAPANSREPRGKMLKRIVELLLEENFQSSRDRIATDFKSTLVCCDSLQFETKLFEIQYRAEKEDTPPPYPKVYQVRVAATGTLGMDTLIQYLSSPSPGDIFDGKEELIQALNIVAGHYPKTRPNTVTIGSNRHFPVDNLAEKWNLQVGLEVLRGYFVSVRAATARLLVNVQVTHIACLAPVPLATLITSSGKSQQRLEQLLKGVSIEVSHIQNTKNGQRTPRIKRIFGLASPRNGRGLEFPPRVARLGAGPKEVQFYLKGPLKGGPTKPATQGGKKGKKGGAPGKDQSRETKDHGYITVYEYFQRVYNITPNVAMPVINVGSSEDPSYLPVEVGRVQTGQPARTKLSTTQAREMIKFAVRKPAANAKSITEKGSQVIGASPRNTSLLESMGLSINPQLITVAGRVLKAPSVKYKAGLVAPRDGGWNLANCKFTQGVKLSQWTFLCLQGTAPTNPGPAVNEFMDVAEKLGLQVTAPLPPLWFGETFSAGSPAGYASKVDRAFDQILTKYPNIKFLLVILPMDDSAIYNRVKQRGDIQNGIHTVCVLAQKFGGVQYCANIALKFNLKLGGTNHILDSSKLGIIGEGKTMLVGIDVTHPSPGSSSVAPSVAAVVASVDKHLGQWPATIRLQRTSKAEMVDELEEMLESRLRLWSKKNKAFPENILIYRDGVSEGQYARVLEEELPLLRKACEGVYPATLTKQGFPRISIIIVGKRHHTRFYPVTEAEADKSSNPFHGTIVDRGVTETRNWDFFLQAHTALHGTARPAHYFVILNEIFKTPKTPGLTAADVLEDLTHNLCYLFGRATRAVSICPPAYYADLACERARRYLSNYYDASPAESVVSGETEQGPSQNHLAIHPNLRDSMFYI